MSAGKPELPRQPGSSAFYDADSPQPVQTPEGSCTNEPESPGSTDDNANNFFQTLDWEGTFTVYSNTVGRNSVLTSLLFSDVRCSQEASDSQGRGSMNDQDELSDQSEGESFSYSAPSGEPLSREPSEPLFDADFQVKQVLKC